MKYHLLSNYLIRYSPSDDIWYVYTVLGEEMPRKSVDGKLTPTHVWRCLAITFPSSRPQKRFSLTHSHRLLGCCQFCLVGSPGVSVAPTAIVAVTVFFQWPGIMERFRSFLLS